MAKYRVITLAMSVKNNRIAKHGEFVDDSELTTNPSLLIEEGYIQGVKSDDTEKVVAEVEVVEETETETEQEEVTEVVETKEAVSKKEEVKAKLAPKK